MTTYWYLFPYLGLAAILIVYLGVRLALDWLDHCQRRKMRGEVYGSSSYVMLGQARPNFRRPG